MRREQWNMNKWAPIPWWDAISVMTGLRINNSDDEGGGSEGGARAKSVRQMNLNARQTIWWCKVDTTSAQAQTHTQDTHEATAKQSTENLENEKLIVKIIMGSVPSQCFYCDMRIGMAFWSLGALISFALCAVARYIFSLAFGNRLTYNKQEQTQKKHTSKKASERREREREVSKSGGAKMLGVQVSDVRALMFSSNFWCLVYISAHFIDVYWVERDSNGSNLSNHIDNAHTHTHTM